MDISLCRNTNCPLRNNCYRFTAKPDEFRQSYTNFSYNPITQSCHHFMQDFTPQQLADMFSAKLEVNAKTDKNQE